MDKDSLARLLTAPITKRELERYPCNAVVIRLTRVGRELHGHLPQCVDDLLSDDEMMCAKKKLVKLGYYSRFERFERNQKMRDCYSNLLQWFIENYPASFVLSVAMRYSRKDQNYANIKKSWLAKCSGSKDVEILNNAALFLCTFDSAKSELLWKKCQDIAPSAQWAYELTSMHWTNALNARSTKARTKSAELAVVHFEQVLTLPNDYPEFSYISGSLIESMLNNLNELSRDLTLSTEGIKTFDRLRSLFKESCKSAE